MGFREKWGAGLTGCFLLWTATGIAVSQELPHITVLINDSANVAAPLMKQESRSSGKTAHQPSWWSSVCSLRRETAFCFTSSQTGRLRKSPSSERPFLALTGPGNTSTYFSTGFRRQAGRLEQTRDDC